MSKEREKKKKNGVGNGDKDLDTLPKVERTAEGGVRRKERRAGRGRCENRDTVVYGLRMVSSLSRTPEMEPRPKYQRSITLYSGGTRTVGLVV